MCCNTASLHPDAPLNSIVESLITRATENELPLLSNVGIVAARVAKGNEPEELLVEYSVGHSSQSMGFGCLGHNCPLSVTFLPRDGTQQDQPVAILGMGMKWNGIDLDRQS